MPTPRLAGTSRVVVAYLLAAGASGASGLAVIAFLDPADRGSYAIATAVPTIFAVVFNGGFLWAVPHFLVRRAGPAGTIVRGAVGTLSSSLVGSLALFALFVVDPGGSLHTESTAIRAAALGALPLLSLCYYAQFTLQGLGRTREFAIAFAMTPILYASSIGVCWIGFGDLTLTNVLVLWYASTIACLLFGAQRLFAEWHQRRRRPSAPAAGGLARHAIKAQSSVAVQHLVYRLDVLIVAAFRSTRELGLYAAATFVAELAWVPARAISQMLWARELSSPDADAAVVTTRASLVAGLLLAGAVAVSGHVLLSEVFTSYRDAEPALFALLPGVAVGSVIVNVNVQLQAAARLRSAFTVALVGLGVAVIAYPSLTVGLGITGAAIASSLVYSVQAALSLWLLSTWTGKKVWLVLRVDVGIREIADALRRKWSARRPQVETGGTAR